MTFARVSAETSVPPRSTLDTVGTLVPAVLATKDRVGRDPAGRGGMGDRLTRRGGRPGAGEAPQPGVESAADGCPSGCGTRPHTERHTDGAGAYSNQSKATAPSVAYMPITRPVKPQATSVDR